MAEGNGNAWLKTPQFSIQNLIQWGPWAGIVVAACLRFWALPDRMDHSDAKADSTKAAIVDVRVRVDHVDAEIDTLRAQAATRRQVQRAIQQGNEINSEQNRRIRALERRGHIASPARERHVEIYGPMPDERREATVTDDLWRDEP